MSGFNIDAGLFMAVRRAMGGEEIRYYLAGVLVEPDESGGAWLVATDGRAMLVARDVTAVAPRRTVISLTLPETPLPSPGCCDEDGCALDTPSYTGARLSFDVDPGGRAVASVKAGAHAWQHPVVHDLDCADKYPDWRGVWTKTKAASPRRGHQGYGVNPDLLARISGGFHVRAVSLGDGRPNVLHFDGAGPLTGLLMPCDLTVLNESIDLAESLLGEALTPEDRT